LTKVAKYGNLDHSNQLLKFGNHVANFQLRIRNTQLSFSPWWRNVLGGFHMSKPRVILETEDFPIKPADINTGGHRVNSFENWETDISAGYIILLMQQKTGWLPFTREEIELTHSQHSTGGKGFAFCRLMGEFRVYGAGNSWLESLDVIVEKDGKYFVTDEFVLRCYRSSPIPRKKSAPQTA
jgi:hypothetical protein